jgi:hypothetical protein
VKPEFREAFDVYLAEARFDNGVIRLLTRVKDLRTHRIAHITRDFVSGNVKLFRPNLLELVELRNALNSLLNALAFNVEYQMLPIPYDDRVLRSNRSAIKTDIEEILDCIAKNSFYLHMPERYPERWRYRRPHLDDEKLSILNQYRRKFDLPDV